MTEAPIRVIASDLDGTLLRHDGTLSDRTKAAIRAAAAAGFTIVIATGRPPRTVQPIAEQLAMEGVAVCSNGAILYDLGEREILGRESVPQAALTALVAALRARDAKISFATEHGHRVGYEPGFPFNANWIEAHPPVIDDIAVLCAEAVVKLAVHHPELTVDLLAEQVRACAGDQVSVTFSSPHFVEVAAAGVSKALGLTRICARLGVTPAQVIAFGDMPNDLAMLSFAGRGIAVANAHPDVKAAGHELTASNDEDGVARVIERLIA